MKRLLLLFIILFTVLYSSNIIAQEVGAMRKSLNINFPEKIQQPLGDPLPAGTYSIGSGGYFPTIDSAFNKLSADGITGAVTLELIDELYVPTDIEFGFFMIGPIPGAGSSSRVTIKPAENKNVTIQNNGSAVFLLLDVSYLTFDGVSLTGPTTLTIHAFENTLYGFNDGIDFVDDCNNNIMQNITFIIDDNKRQSGSGFWFSVVGDGPDNNLIQNNFVKKAGLGLYIIAPSSSYRGRDNIIRGNFIGSDTDSLTAYGICASKCENTIIENNIIQNLKTTLVGTDGFQAGIVSENGLRDIIRNNLVCKLRAISGFMTAGIVLAGSGGSLGIDIEAYNNIIYDIQSTSSQSNSRLSGIELWYVSKPKVYYNSINISGNGANPLGSAALYINVGVTDVELKNNILVNNRNESPYCASIIRILPGTTFSITDFNDFYYTAGSNNCLVRLGSTEYMTLTDWQNAIGQDFNSIFEMPHFISTSDLHIDKTFPTNLEKGATPIAGIDTDFDADLRNASTPDIGADEFDGYTYEDPLPDGTYRVGTGGNFATIQDAFNKLETDGVAGNVTLELIDELYTAPTDSFGFKLNGPIPGAGPNSRVTIKPAENKNVVIEGSGHIVMSCINTSYITLDGFGVSGATTLTFHAYKNAQYGWNDCLSFWNNSDHNIIRNITYICDDITGIGGGVGFYTRVGFTAAADSNIIQNNFIKKSGKGSIYVSSFYSPISATGNIIRENQIGSETDSLIAWGIQIERCKNTIVENNIIQNLKSTPNIGEILNIGINSYFGNGDIIRNNVVHNIKSNTGYTCVGILLSGGTGTNNMVYNNMIYDIQSTSTQLNSRVAGIQIWNQEYPKIYYNTVYLSGNGNGANPLGSAALYIYGGFSGSPGVDLKNNIFVNTRDESPYCASAVYDYNIYNLASDYNDLYYDDTNQNNCLVRIGNTDYHSLADWQSTGKDAHSITEMPNFVAPDLHIDDSLFSLIDGGATPIAGIETDFDGESRNTTVPDIGADEFLIVGVEDEETLPTEFALEQNYPNPFNPTTTFRYSIPTQSKVVIKVFDILGNEVATLMDEEKSVGTYELTWNAGSLPSGVYFYQLKAGEFVNTKKMILLK